MNPYDEVAAELLRVDDGIRKALGAPEDVTSEWFTERWVGSGTYARAYRVKWEGADAAFKLTLDVDECDISEKTTEEDHPIRGLVYVYMAGWLDFEDIIEGEEMDIRSPNCVVITEWADTVLTGWRADAMAACMYALDRLDWWEDHADHWEGLTQNLTKEQREIAYTWLTDLREGLMWIGDVPIPDTNEGNAGIVLRKGREMAVWVDFGQWG